VAKIERQRIRISEVGRAKNPEKRGKKVKSDKKREKLRWKTREKKR